jgi:hypothetical protein
MNISSLVYCIVFFSLRYSTNILVCSRHHRTVYSTSGRRSKSKSTECGLIVSRNTGIGSTAASLGFNMYRRTTCARIDLSSTFAKFWPMQFRGPIEKGKYAGDFPCLMLLREEGSSSKNRSGTKSSGRSGQCSLDMCVYRGKT